jgi:glycine cleavage system aminomethyltransferase T
MGKEPICVGGDVVGYVTSAGYGYAVDRSIAYGYLPSELATVGTKVEVEYFGERHRATVVREPLFDPLGERLRY